MNELPLAIGNFFLAMQAGPSGLEALGKMFHDDAEYSEPFSGQSVPHKGRSAILKAFDDSRSDEFDDAVIVLNHVAVKGDFISIGWTCISQAIPGGRGSGTNVFEMQDGMIKSLKTTLDG